MVMRNPRAREAIIGAAAGAASRVNTKVRESAEEFVAREVAPLRAQIAELEERIARLERLVGGDGTASRPGHLDRDSV